jgi:hypothetical protein
MRFLPDWKLSGVLGAMLSVSALSLPVVAAAQTILPVYPAQWGPPPGPYVKALSDFGQFVDNMVPAHIVARGIHTGQLSGVGQIPLDARIQEVRLTRISSGTFAPGAIPAEVLPMLSNGQQSPVYVQVPTGTFGIPPHTQSLGIYGVNSYGTGGTGTFTVNPYTGQAWQRGELLSLQVGALFRWDNSQGNTAQAAQRLQFNEFTVEVVYRTGPVPTLTVSPATLTRDGVATFTVTAGPSAVIDNWSFSGAGLTPISRTSGINASTWSGIIVAPGSASVRVVQDGETFNLTQAVAVTPRNWSWVAVAPTQVPNGTFVTLPSPPVNNGMLGAALLEAEFSFDAAVMSGEGPNKGVRYITAIRDTSSAGPTRFRYQLSSDLMANNSAFYKAQCGTYNAQTGTGFIRGSTLRSNVTEHEYGTVLGHYQQYATTLLAPADNVGQLAESRVSNMDASDLAFVTRLVGDLGAAATRLEDATHSETACNSVVNRDTSCTYRGLVNYAPYFPCR